MYTYILSSVCHPFLKQFYNLVRNFRRLGTSALFRDGQNPSQGQMSEAISWQVVNGLDEKIDFKHLL